LWLTGVEISGAGSQIGLHGRALSADAVPAWINRLTREPVLRGKTFGSLQISRPRLEEPGAKAGAPAAAAVDAPYIEFSLQAAGGNAEGAP
jgi:hypothetical protein